MTSETTSPVSRDRLVFLHGFTQTHHHWHRCACLIAGRLTAPASLTLVDLPGHGLSTADQLSITEAGSALAALAGRATYVGYSMGGRFALSLALTHPDVVDRLVLIGATPGIADRSERLVRVEADHERANRVGQIGVEAFLDDWLSAPLFATMTPEMSGLDDRLRNTAGGLASSLRMAGTGTQDSLWSALAQLVMPVLVIAGERDEKFSAIGRRMVEVLPQGEFAPIKEAGHAAHAERPVATAEVIATWLERSGHQTEVASAAER